MLLDARRHGEDVRVEDDVLGRESDLVDEQIVGALADLLAALEVVGLPSSSKAMTTTARAVLAAQSVCLLEELDALLHRMELTIALALRAFSPASMTSHFEESIISGHAADVGSPRSV